jgi:hypothetical protein
MCWLGFADRPSHQRILHEDGHSPAECCRAAVVAGLPEALPHAEGTGPRHAVLPASPRLSPIVAGFKLLLTTLFFWVKLVYYTTLYCHRMRPTPHDRKARLIAEAWSRRRGCNHLGSPKTHLPLDRLQNLPAHKLGRLWKCKLSEVDAWVRARGAAGTQGALQGRPNALAYHQPPCQRHSLRLSPSRTRSLASGEADRVLPLWTSRVTDRTCWRKALGAGGNDPGQAHHHQMSARSWHTT